MRNLVLRSFVPLLASTRRDAPIAVVPDPQIVGAAAVTAS
jgi:hypothetical protein